MDRRTLMLLVPGRLEWATEALPELGPHEVVVSTAFERMACGETTPINVFVAYSDDHAV